MSRRIRNWCDICRDVDTNVKCSNPGCTRRFHDVCLRSMEDWVGNFDDYVCSYCTFNNINDGSCYICNKVVIGNEQGKNKNQEAQEQITRDKVDTTLVLLCDGCTNSVHIKCLDLKAPLHLNDNDLWYCPECDPHGEAAQNMNTTDKTQSKKNDSTSLKAAGELLNIGGNVEICYVCQKGGKLLGCDFCEQSYHPRCIDNEFLEFESGQEKWQCPICKGEDPLKSFGNRKLSRTAMARLMNEMQNCIRTHHKSSKNNRDKFLWESRFELKPFLTDKAVMKLNKQFGENINRSMNDTDTEEDDMNENKDEECKLNAETLKYYQTAERTSKNGILKQGVELKEYQKYGVGWLLQSFFNRAGAILADEMGLGKTIQCLAFLSALKILGITGPHLIVVPLSTVGNWAREIRRFVPHLKFVKICGSRFERDHIMSDPVAAQGLHDLYITTYETAVTEEAFFCDNFDWQCIILDEAHRIKNESGRIRHSLDRVYANMRVLLTGTPLQNNLKELFTLLNFLFPEILYNSNKFEKMFVKNSFSSNKEISANENIESTIDRAALEGISHLLSKMMLRRTKKLVVKLPKKIEHDIWLPLSTESATWYKRLLDISEAAFQADSVCKMLGTVIKMRICTCHPRSLLSHEKHLKKFKEMFAGVETEQKIEQDAYRLCYLTGEEHINASNKLVLLDKLLVQLHLQNCKENETYKNAYIENIKDIYLKKNPIPLNFNWQGSTQKTEQKNKNKDDHNKQETIEIENKTEKQPSSRQLAERARRERLAIANKQQKEYEFYISELADNKLAQLEKNWVNEPWLEETMYTRITNIDEVKPALDTKKSEDDDNIDENNELYIDSDDDDKEKTEKGRKLIHKVLVFTQFQLVLNELEQYCKHRGFKYFRLDGNTNKMIRELDIREFNDNKSTYLLYLICTRAGGVGINLVTANHVVLFDEDWNPFMDLQAIDRAHRIGQQREVHVWKLVTEWTIEEKMAFRRMQKLQLDKIFIQSSNNKTVTEDSFSDIESDKIDKSAVQKMSVEEVKRLIRYGREAVKSLVNGTENIRACTLTEIMNRKRKDLPKICNEEIMQTSQEIEDNDEISLNFDEKSLLLPSLSSNMNASVPDNINDTNTAKEEIFDDTLINPINTEIEDIDRNPIKENEDDTTKTKRSRRKVQIYNTNVQIVPKRKEERRVQHDKKCFKCGTGNNSLNENADPLIPCYRCPRVYHLNGCLGLSEIPRKTWICAWHECCLCFRKGSQAGGLLIHCAECPTTFCFDCFPPEYRRYTPPATYFASLQRRGYNVSSEKMVLFLCSRCKALKEQQRRRQLTKQQLEKELKDKKEAQTRLNFISKKQLSKQSELKIDTPADLVNALLKRGGNIKKKFLARKKLIDEEDKNTLNKIKTEYERLFPKQYIDCLNERRKEQFMIRNEAVNAHKSNLNTKIVKPILSRLPHEFCKVCENCHIPGHEAQNCPFPAEFSRQPNNVELNNNDNITEKENLLTNNDEDSETVQEFNKLDENIYLADENQKNEERTDEKPVTNKDSVENLQAKKATVKSYCPKCGVGSRNHLRRHCELLTEKEKQEYKDRKTCVFKFIELLKNQPTIEIGEELDINLNNIEIVRKILQRKVDLIVVDCLIKANLGNCVSNKLKRLVEISQLENLSPPKKRKKKQKASTETEADDNNNNSNLINNNITIIDEYHIVEHNNPQYNKFDDVAGTDFENNVNLSKNYEFFQIDTASNNTKKIKTSNSYKSNKKNKNSITDFDSNTDIEDIESAYVNQIDPNLNNNSTMNIISNQNNNYIDEANNDYKSSIEIINEYNSIPNNSVKYMPANTLQANMINPIFMQNQQRTELTNYQANYNSHNHAQKPINNFFHPYYKQQPMSLVHNNNYSRPQLVYPQNLQSAEFQYSNNTDAKLNQVNNFMSNYQNYMFGNKHNTGIASSEANNNLSGANKNNIVNEVNTNNGITPPILTAMQPDSYFSMSSVDESSMMILNYNRNQMNIYPNTGELDN